ncbi:helix-turn-helix domain-containing protein [Pseudoalteromonas luteoviolacea]|uniref:helix-turn-helix domain-containing protein n=1 Tax=Pseudoalteromonas luteoviolacea TaxID=43657 RepID=UPI001B3A0E2B|nr:helix-turn-helix domain-containing protein [Pseudoalteromonas luteoviolacea]MBQ4879653.1 helix-turn-helix domain-containing protein [Pseudoalteromonas luteoviolacea]MBQ4908673.1 helix-turn-helix domain-containing protein [Pseudoalteromonas luteoviolacea]
MKSETTTKVMSYEDIKKELKERNVLLSDIASAQKVSKAAIYNVAQGKAKSIRIAQVIASLLGKPISQVFGDLYNQAENMTKEERVNSILSALDSNTPLPIKSMAQ